MNHPKLPAEKVCVLSTKYITPTDGTLLDVQESERFSNLPRVETHEYGWLVFVSSEPEVRYGHAEAMRNNPAGFSDDGPSVRMSDAFVRLYLEAGMQGFHIIDLDRDGEEVDGLPEFEW